MSIKVVSAGGGGSALIVKEDAVQILAEASALDFKGFNVEDGGSNVAHIYPDLRGMSGFRLSLEDGVSVSTTDQANKSTLYLTPHTSNLIWLYDGTRWVRRASAQISLDLTNTLTANVPHDIFVYDNAGTLAFRAPVAWTNTTTRATALTTQDGVLVKTGATTDLYHGTLHATSVSQTQDTGLPAAGTSPKRFVYNWYNPVWRPMRAIDTTDSWVYDTTSFREARGQTTNRLEFVVGVSRWPVCARVVHHASADAENQMWIGIGLDRTDTNDATLTGPTNIETIFAIAAWAEYQGFPGIGYHYLSWLERANSATTTWYGDANAPGQLQSGIIGGVFA